MREDLISKEDSIKFKKKKQKLMVVSEGRG